MGGLPKKAYIIKELTQKQNKSALVIDSGNLLFKADSLPPEAMTKAKITADGILQAYRTMGGTLAGIGNRDLAAGPGFLQPSHRPPDFTWLSLNLVDPAKRKPLFLPWHIRIIGGLRIAVLALTDHSAAPSPQGEFVIRPWREVLPAALGQVETKADMIVLLSNYSYLENKEIARNHGAIDLILQSGHVAGILDPIVINQTLIAQTDTRGRYLGLLDITWNGGGRWRGTPGASQTKADTPPSTFSSRFIALVPSIADEPQVDQIVRHTKRRLDRSR